MNQLFNLLATLLSKTNTRNEIDQATGISIAFATTSFTALIKGAVESSISRGSVDTTHSGTTPNGDSNVYRTFQPSDILDSNEVQLLLHYDVDEVIPIGKAAETVTISFPIPPGSGETVKASIASQAFFTEFSFTANPLDDETMEASVTLKRSGEPTYVVGS